MNIARRQFIEGLAAAGAAAMVLGHRSARGRAFPNVVVMVADDLGWTDLGCYGSTFYDTPHLDGLAARGLRFTQAYATCPVCSPTRASIVTGKFPARLATTDWFGAPQPDAVPEHPRMRSLPLLPAPYLDHLPLEEVTIAEAFREGGYRTFFGGKWHLGGEGYLPEDQGFDVNRGGNHRGGPPSYFSPYKNPQLADGPEGEHLPDRLASELLSFAGAEPDRPFFALLPFYSVHTPLQGRPDLVKKYEDRGKSRLTAWGREGEREVRLVQNHAVYGAMVEAMDEAVGKILKGLEALGLGDDTIVVFTSDNGGLSTSEGHPTSNLPLRAGKGWLYEGGIRVPLILQGPGLTRGGSVVPAPVCSADLYPTLLDLAGLPLRPEQHLDGVSLRGVCAGDEATNRDVLYWHYPHYGNQGGSPGAAIREGDWKLIVHFEARPAELYNLRDDPGETHDRAGEAPERVAALRARLSAWQAAVGARFPTDNPAISSGA